MKKSNKKTNVKNQKQLLNEKEQLVKEALNSNLDELNLDSLLDKVTVKNPTATNGERKSSLYKELDNKKLDKQQRKTVRNKRNKLINNILFYAQQKQLKELKETIKEFNSFYKETYLLNDYSINSIASKNSDKDTMEKVEIFFKIVKEFKIK